MRRELLCWLDIWTCRVSDCVTGLVRARLTVSVFSRCCQLLLPGQTQSAARGEIFLNSCQPQLSVSSHNRRQLSSPLPSTGWSEPVIGISRIVNILLSSHHKTQPRCARFSRRGVWLYIWLLFDISEILRFLMGRSKKSVETVKDSASSSPTPMEATMDSPKESPKEVNFLFLTPQFPS